MADERTPHGFSKLVFGTPQPCAFINQAHIIYDLTQASLERTIVAGFAVVPAFNGPQPDAGDWAGIVTYRDTDNEPILDNNFRPIINPIPANAAHENDDPALPLIQPSAFTLREIDTLNKLAYS